ncbi:MAG: TatD family hydrolase [Marinobacter sp.]|nr:TatD family hydrolase [Marinobacter sp.]
MALVDAHCHFDFPAFDQDRASLLAAFASKGIERLVIPGVRPSDWSRVAQTAALDARLYYCLGIHPWFAGEATPESMADLRQRLAADPARCVAVGECGLDRWRGDLAVQQPVFEAQVRLAQACDLPLVIHSVRTHDEVAATLRRLRYQGRALVHGFSGSEQQARRLFAEGCYLGVGGIITHARAAKTRATIAAAPLACLVLETDAPDMAPAGVAKGANSPVYLTRVFEALCGLRAEPEQVVRQALLDNVRRLYAWSE